MNHIPKVFLRVVHERVYKKVDDRIAGNQRGLRRGFDTRKALFTSYVVIEQCHRTATYVCF